MTVQLRISIPKDDDINLEASPRCAEPRYGRDRCDSITQLGLTALSIPVAIITLPIVLTATCGVSLYNLVNCLLFMDCDNLSPSPDQARKSEEP